MENNNYWSVETFDSWVLPENYEEVIAEANRLIDKGDDPEDLWDEFCATDRVGDVFAEW